MLTEIYFADIFSQYGTVVDLSVKKFEINEVRTVAVIHISILINHGFNTLVADDNICDII